jgi:hypothetical protein
MKIEQLFFARWGWVNRRRFVTLLTILYGSGGCLVGAWILASSEISSIVAWGLVMTSFYFAGYLFAIGMWKYFSGFLNSRT